MKEIGAPCASSPRLPVVVAVSSFISQRAQRDPQSSAVRHRRALSGSAFVYARTTPQDAGCGRVDRSPRWSRRDSRARRRRNLTRTARGHAPKRTHPASAPGLVQPAGPGSCTHRRHSSRRPVDLPVGSRPRRILGHRRWPSSRCRGVERLPATFSPRREKAASAMRARDGSLAAAHDAAWWSIPAVGRPDPRSLAPHGLRRWRTADGRRRLGASPEACSAHRTAAELRRSPMDRSESVAGCRRSLRVRHRDPVLASTAAPRSAQTGRDLRHRTS